MANDSHRADDTGVSNTGVSNTGAASGYTTSTTTATHSGSDSVDAAAADAAVTATQVSAADTAVASDDEATLVAGAEVGASSAEVAAEEAVDPAEEAEYSGDDACVAEIRANALAMAAIEARQLRLVAQLANEVEADATAMLASGFRVAGAPQDHEVIESAVVGELQAVLGIAQGPAGRLVDLAQRLTKVLPEVLVALESGRLDLIRARVLAEATEVLTDLAAREVAQQMLAVAGDCPWDGLSSRAWRARTDRTVVRVDADAARRRRKEAYERRALRSWPTSDGMAELFIAADAADIAMAEQVLTDLARARPATDDAGEHVSMDARRVDSFMDVFRRVRDGQALPGVPVRRERELGLVLHADTFFGDGPAASDPGEVRGLSGPSPLDPVTARERARAFVGRVGGASADMVGRASGGMVEGTVGDGPIVTVEGTVRDGPIGMVGGAPGGGDVATSERAGAINVLLVDSHGVLQRLVRLPQAPKGGWTRQLLDAAITARLDELPVLSCDGYVPTSAIEDLVRARNPRCTGYDCPRRAHACDLDHDTPWPRGPTDVVNLAPRCRRHHEHKTRGLVRTTLHGDGWVDTQMFTGIVVTTRPEPLPGYAPGEGHASRATAPA